MRYTVLNMKTEQESDHGSWSAAFSAAKRQKSDSVVVIERDRDGSRTYNLKGEVIERE